MPNRDGTGPCGKGPLTGRKIGNCVENTNLGNDCPGRGRCCGGRKGRGAGQGRNGAGNRGKGMGKN
ncbi:MAG TPA: DUF5320 domain-containing protein [Candidatus Absconditabacterales bacterium]|nr:DUF5320 domain-containing protein [Candidatus Absconditabacterales bacterium]